VLVSVLGIGFEDDGVIGDADHFEQSAMSSAAGRWAGLPAGSLSLQMMRGAQPLRNKWAA